MAELLQSPSWNATSHGDLWVTALQGPLAPSLGTTARSWQPVPLQMSKQSYATTVGPRKRGRHRKEEEPWAFGGGLALRVFGWGGWSLGSGNMAGWQWKVFWRQKLMHVWGCRDRRTPGQGCSAGGRKLTRPLQWQREQVRRAGRWPTSPGWGFLFLWLPHDPGGVEQQEFHPQGSRG